MLRLYDTLSNAIQSFKPAGSPVKLYVCGVTPYDTTHLGHAFTFGSFDVLIRYLQYLGHPVRYIQNVTDVDDPLFEKARQIGESHWDLAAEQTERYHADMQALNVLPAEVYPRASGEIPEMIEIVERLVAGGHAYVVDGHVYFSVRSDPGYGRLSKYDREEMIEIARERGGDPDDPLRRDPLDFLLWRPARPDEPKASSPWGEGLPGWHLECSAMALKYLGAPLDIHGGGMDLVFPHHESEIAQSEGFTGRQPFSRFWVHVGMVRYQGEKMSKSLGNLVFLRDVLHTQSADALRLYLLSHHYREPFEYLESGPVEFELLVVLLRQVVMLRGGEGEPFDLGDLQSRFLAAVGDDLNTPAAIDILREMAAALVAAAERGQEIETARKQLREVGSILGLTVTR